MKVFFGLKTCGLLCISIKGWNFHFLILNPKDWILGKKKEWIDGEYIYYGLGPIFMVAWSEWK